jgi:hypothetical protein
LNNRQLNNDLNESALNALNALPDGTDVIKDKGIVNNDDGSGQESSTNGNQQEPSEDYEGYVARQAEKVAEIDKEYLQNQKHNEAQKSAAVRRIFDELASKNAETNPGTNEVLESTFREALAYNGMSDADIDATIKGFENDKIIERVRTELDGVMCDILRVIN